VKGAHLQVYAWLRSGLSRFSARPLQEEAAGAFLNHSSSITSREQLESKVRVWSFCALRLYNLVEPSTLGRWEGALRLCSVSACASPILASDFHHVQ